jgi:hypothetical protein
MPLGEMQGSICHIQEWVASFYLGLTSELYEKMLPLTGTLAAPNAQLSF